MNNIYYPQMSMVNNSNWNVPPEPLSSVMLPRYGRIIGKVFQRGQDTILWDGFGHFPLTSSSAMRLCSPYFHLVGSTLWSLAIESSFPLFCRLVLKRCDIRSAKKTLHCKVVVKSTGGKEEVYSRSLQDLDREFLISEHIPFAQLLAITLHLTEGEVASQGLKRKAEVFDVESGQEIEDQSDDCRCSKAKGVGLLSQHLNDYLEKSDGCDVRFHVQHKEFPAHSFILKARCPVFCMMLTHDSQEKKSGIIRIEDCDADAFGIFLAYLYTGKVKGLMPKKALDLYYIADKYDFSDLKEKCVALLKRSLSKTTLCDVVLFSTTHDDSELLEAAKNFFVQNIKEITETVEWQDFMAKHPAEANELYTKYVNMSVLSGSMGNYGPS